MCCCKVYPDTQRKVFSEFILIFTIRKYFSRESFTFEYSLTCTIRNFNVECFSVLVISDENGTLKRVPRREENLSDYYLS